MATGSLEAAAEAHDTFPINGTDYVEFWVGNAKQASHFYRSAFGFQLDRLPRPRDRRARPGELPAAAGQDPPRAHDGAARRMGPEAGRIAEHVQKHGDGVRDIAMWVDDARDAFAKAVERGADAGARARGAARRRRRDRHRRVSGSTATRSTRSSSVGTTAGCSCRASSPCRRATQPDEVGLKYVDHCVGNVELGKMNEWVGVLRPRDGLPQPAHASTTRRSAPSTRR